jgi:hypothetical protein
MQEDVERIEKNERIVKEWIIKRKGFRRRS